ELFKKWYKEGQRKVVLKVEDEKELFALHEIAKSSGIISTVVVDAGLTEIPPETPTCICLGPDEEEKIDKLTGDYALG
ncbi:MAG TPA: aminoacyl-tRNA hydrolase, partial [Thermoplasmata archaeon]|nr:aminoacyl-tRNA hydrolase [Thermoplasmata archaeon]